MYFCPSLLPRLGLSVSLESSPPLPGAVVWSAATTKDHAPRPPLQCHQPLAGDVGQGPSAVNGFFVPGPNIKLHLPSTSPFPYRANTVYRVLPGKTGGEEVTWQVLQDKLWNSQGNEIKSQQLKDAVCF